MTKKKKNWQIVPIVFLIFMSFVLFVRSNESNKRLERNNAITDLQNADEEYKNNKEIILQAVRYNAQQLKDVSKQMSDDEYREIVKIIVNNNPASFEHARDNIKEDKKFITEVLACREDHRENWSNFVQAIPDHVINKLDKDDSDDIKLATLIIKVSPMKLQVLPEEFKNNKEVVIVAVTKEGTAIKHASEELQTDQEVVKAAFTNFQTIKEVYNILKVPSHNDSFNKFYEKNKKDKILRSKFFRNGIEFEKI